MMTGDDVADAVDAVGPDASADLLGHHVFQPGPTVLAVTAK
jgi:hypothetical protein